MLVEDIIQFGAVRFVFFFGNGFMRPFRSLLAFCLPLVVSGFVGFLPAAASAQAAGNDPCAKLGAVMQERVKIIAQVQGFKEKKPTAQEACSVFTKLSSVNKSAVDGLVRDGAWCRAPESVAESLRQQQGQIDAGKENTCKAAADQKKMESQQGAAAPGQKMGPLGGTGDILGGPQKLPQGAL